MSERFVLTTIKNILGKDLFKSPNDIVVTLTSDVVEFDELIFIEPIATDLGSRVTLWFEDKPIFVKSFYKAGENSIQIEKSEFDIPGGKYATISERISINDFSIINYGVRTSSPYAIIEIGENQRTQRSGYLVKIFTIPLHFLVSWEDSESSLNKLLTLSDKIQRLLEKKIYIPNGHLPLKLIDIELTQKPTVLFHPNTPDGAQPIPIYVSRQFNLFIECYYNEEMYAGFNMTEFWTDL